MPHALTLAVSEIVFQFPPLRVNFPLPIRVRISSGVSLGPLANGVYLEKKSRNRRPGLWLPCPLGSSEGSFFLLVFLLSSQGLPSSGTLWPDPRTGAPGTGGQASGHSPCQHGVEQDAQAPDVTAFIVALALQHLAEGRRGKRTVLWGAATSTQAGFSVAMQEACTM